MKRSISPIYDAFRDVAEAQSDAVAIVHNRRAGLEEATYRELNERVVAIAEELDRRSGSIVLTHVSKSIDSVATLLGATAVGRPFACLNRGLRPNQILQIIRSTGARFCFFDPGGYVGLAKLMTERGEHWEFTDASAVRGLAIGLSVEAEDTYIGKDEILSKSGACLFTSGSTGYPKGVLVERKDLLERARAETRLYDLSTDDTLLSILPFSFDVGLNQLLSGLLAGARIILEDSWLPVDIVRSVQTFGVTGISGVPSIWKDMLVAGVTFQGIQQAGSCLRYITVSGGDLPRPLLARLPELAPGIDIYKTYGQTESFRTTALLPKEFGTKFKSVGRSFEGVAFFVIRDDGTLCDPFEPGEVVHTGLGVMLGYLDGDRESKLRLAKGPTSAWATPAIYTGDIGYVDEGGYLYLNGRMDNMLKIASNRVYPNDILSVLLEHQGIQDGFVLGADTGYSEKVLVAFVVSRMGSQVNERDLRRFVASSLPPYMQPQRFCFLNNLPRTESGKPDGRLMMEMANALTGKCSSGGRTR